MGFDSGAIDIAYDRTVVKTGRFVWGYMDGILKNWHSKGIHTARDVAAKDGKQGRNGTSGGMEALDQKFGVPNQEDILRMQKLLNKIKED
jgi:DNA replication protein DnaD